MAEGCRREGGEGVGESVGETCVEGNALDFGEEERSVRAPET